jgi:predicted CXXCH cytochrome family protein
VEVLVRYLTKKRDGAISARDELVICETVSLGRSTDNEVELPAPGVLLHEGVLHKREGGLFFEGEGEGRNNVSIDGLPVSAGPVKVGSVIGIGPYDVTVLSPEGDADLAVSVELVRPIGDALETLRANSTTRIEQSGISKRPLAWGALVVILLAFLVWPVVEAFVIDRTDPALSKNPIEMAIETESWPMAADLAWVTGPVSGPHKFLAQNCSFCHERPFVRVQDNVCTDCHAEITNHVDPKVHDLPEVSTALCQSCHKEHQGAAPIMRQDQAFCSSCHEDLEDVANDTKLFNVSNFGRDHPEFRPTVVTDAAAGTVVRVLLDPANWPVESSNLVFTHKRHLNPEGILVPGKRERRVMDCADCHTTDEGGAGFSAVVMEDNCSECHQLNFEPTVPTRQLPHGNVETVIESLREFYGNLALRGGAEVKDAPAVVRRRPGGRKLSEEERLEALDWADKAARDAGDRVFAKSVCGTCHEVTRTGDGPLDYSVAPVMVVDRWMPKGRFDHSRHSAPGCVDCHAAPDSDKATDVLLPQIATCQACHGGESAAQRVPSTCVACHDFHLDFHQPMRTSVQNARAEGG